MTKNTTVALHMSRKPNRRDWGVVIQTTPAGRYLVRQVSPSPIYGQLHMLTLATVTTETEARKIANREWVGLGC